MKKLTALAKQFFKFGLVGLSNTAISLIVYYLLLDSLGAVMAYLAGFVVSVINAYFWSSRFVFKKHTEVTPNTNTTKTKTTAKKVLKVFVSYGFTAFLGAMLIKLQVDYFSISDKLAPLFTLFVTVPLNFVLNKFWAFK